MIFESFVDGETISVVLFFIGVYGICARRNILKSIISIGIVQAAIILFFLSIKADPAAVPPIGANIADYARVADPVPQALMITAIVVGISVTALSLTMFVNLHHKYGSSNWNKVKRKRRDID